MRTAIVLALSATLILMLGAGARAETYAYPDKGQSAERQQRDKQDCQEWATKQSGFDPSSPTARPKPGGAAGGAALGATRGAMEGEAGEGAARGAMRGRLLGAIRRRREERQQDAGGQSADTPHGTREDYDRAYGACLTGRGYTVR